MKNLLKLFSFALIFFAASAAAQVSNVEGLTPLDGVPTKRQSNIESSDNQREDKFWEDVKSAGNKKAFEAYIKQYPNGRFIDLAKAYIERMKSNPAPITNALPTNSLMAAVLWSYEGDNGPQHWGDTFPICEAGEKQSPINIVDPFERSYDVLNVDYKVGPLKLLNNGHTIQVNVEAGSTLTINHDIFHLLQFHFHRPSEEQINGKNSAMILHFVHKSQDGKLAILGVLLNEGKDNGAIKTLWANLPLRQGEEYRPEKVNFNPTALIPKELGFYNYEGSFSTPPCTEGVQFYILKKPMEISKDQVAKFPYKLNARPIQSLNGRQIGASSN